MTETLGKGRVETQDERASLKRNIQPKRVRKSNIKQSKMMYLILASFDHFKPIQRAKPQKELETTLVGKPFVKVYSN